MGGNILLVTTILTVSYFSDFSITPIEEEDMNNSDDEEDTRSLVSRVVTQLLCSNAVKYKPKKNAKQLYQSKTIETSVTIWNGLKMGVQRRLTSIAFNHRLGISISASRVSEIRTNEAKAVCKQWNNVGLVYPVNVLRNT